MALARLKELESDAKKCFRCSLCKMIPLPAVTNPKYSDGCPANREYEFHSYSGSGKQIMTVSLLEGRIKTNKKLADITNACTSCGSCDVSCKFIMEAERQQINTALREHIVEEGFGLPEHQKSIDNLLKIGHIADHPQNLPGSWAKNLGIKILPQEKAEVLLFAGCAQRDDQNSIEVTQKFAKILQHAGIDFGILGDDEPSCGLPAYWTGYRDAFTKMSSKTVSVLDSLDVKTVVTVSGSCLGSLRSKFPEYAKSPDAEVLHATEYLWKLIKDKKLTLPKTVKRSVTYHDPCYLGRQSEPPVENWTGESKMALGCMTYNVPPRPIHRGDKGVYYPPRNILKSIKGLTFVEMFRIREYSFCCGGGGGVPEAYPELAQSTAMHRIDEAIDTGADSLVTACHECRINFSKAQRLSGKKNMPILDIVDLVYEAAGI